MNVYCYSQVCTVIIINDLWGITGYLSELFPHNDWKGTTHKGLLLSFLLKYIIMDNIHSVCMLSENAARSKINIEVKYARFNSLLLNVFYFQTLLWGRGNSPEQNKYGYLSNSGLDTVERHIQTRLHMHIKLSSRSFHKSDHKNRCAVFSQINTSVFIELPA